MINDFVFCKISDLWLLKDELGLEVGRWKLEVRPDTPPLPSNTPTLNPAPHTTYPVSRIPYPETNQTLSLTNSLRQIQKSKTEFVYLED